MTNIADKQSIEEKQSQLENHVIDLEMRVAYMDDTIDTLNNIVCQQRDQMDMLTKKLERCQLQLETLLPLLYEKPEDEPPPPHY